MTTFRYYGCGPWFSVGTGSPLLLAVGADSATSALVRDAVDGMHESAPPALLYPDPPTGPLYLDSTLSLKPRVDTSLVSRPRLTWTGTIDDPDSLGPLAPLLHDVRRFGLLCASTDVVQLHLDARPSPGSTTPVITWSPTKPDQWTRRELVEGRDFRANDLRTGRQAESFASLAPNATSIERWNDLTIHATFRSRQALNALVDRARTGTPPSPEQAAAVVAALDDVDGLVAHLLALDAGTSDR